MRGSLVDPATVDGLRRDLLDHYDRERRDLPWRRERDPYRILVSEVMLQQTRVETVLDYYGRWLARFPDVGALAAASEDDVLQAWEGLGYYRRARNLRRAALVVREEGGLLPPDCEGLRRLPGVGEYTAGAVASIAFGERVPAVDGNVRRVLARLFDEPDPSAAWLREVAAELVDPERPGDWNQALMDLGATVCTPRSPACGRCPWEGGCAAREAGTQEERPARLRKAPPRVATFALAVLWARGRVLVVRRSAEGLLGGMWAFPEVEVGDAQEARGAVVALAGKLGVGRGVVGEPVGREVAGGAGEAEPAAHHAEVGGCGRAPAIRPLPTVRHRFSHLLATYVPWLVEVEPFDAGPEGRWIEPVRRRDGADGGDESRGEVALPTAQRRVLASVGGGIRTTREAGRKAVREVATVAGRRGGARGDA